MRPCRPQVWATPEGIEITNARLSDRNEQYTELLYRRLQRQGALYRDCLRMVNQDRNVFAACMVADGDADAMVTGVTRSFSTALEEIRRVIDPSPAISCSGSPSSSPTAARCFWPTPPCTSCLRRRSWRTSRRRPPRWRAAWA